MAIDKSSEERRGDFRQLLDYIHKLFTVVMVALLAWAGTSINQGNVSIALLTQRVEQIGEQLKTVSSDKYSAAEATRDLAVRDQRISGLEDRIVRLENKP